jgi:hypothetical protein
MDSSVCLGFRVGLTPEFRRDAIIVGPSPCPSDSSGNGGVEIPAKAGPTAASERSWDAIDNGDTDRKVEQLKLPSALDRGCTINAVRSSPLVQSIAFLRA